MIDETAAEIEAMRTHSSSEVAIKAARALTELADREYATVEEFERDLERNAGALRRANPSHASLATVLDEIESAVDDGAFETVDAAQDGLEAAVDATIGVVEVAKDEASATAAQLLSDGDVVLTHDYSSTVIGAIERATSAGAELDVYVTEARPRFLGRRTARRLAEIDGVDPTLVVDSAAGHVLQSVDRVLTGMTCVVGDTLYNRVGTYPLAATAQDVGVPVTVTGSSAKIVDSGFVFENDFRDPVEVLREPAEGFDIENPAYDATPLELIDQLATDRGVSEP
ncbi:initiation factor 2B-like protein [Salinarchaeum sp. Harcht-Bsk1]|uniref:translation initiation factor eIF-2B n=1 Tax=Salinarchaeum sp. Harcht-Bsk1 TaxID=1333523 RepID=UPI0003424226|nr:translation initiation factor eIF-2B [Salinarchaeum sp. Harcht-Bsk1]AGN02458.1 initiation factor 2B-like protein [Salinarchaeum sp. Harcht-Bsk1]